MKSGLHIAYLGPEGTFSHLVAKKRFGASARLFPQTSVFDVFDFVRGRRSRLGVVPIENSSGGTIYETVDCLVDDANDLSILEDLSLNVRLALMGRRGEEIETIFSHFVPMRHCEPWLRKNYPDAKRVPVASTAKAAEMAASEQNAAALGTRDAAKRNGLDVLEFPVHSGVPNITQFYVIGRASQTARLRSSRTTIVVTLPNQPGGLCDFLDCFKRGNVNLTRLLSRPIIGRHKAYLFVIDIAGTRSDPAIADALKAAAELSESLRVLGVYPVRSMYAS
jgi:prephenate dehydratase